MEPHTAVILVAGEGTRLRPYTLTQPKCLLDVGGKPLLDWIVSALGSFGIRRIVLVVGYREAEVRLHAQRYTDMDVVLVRNGAYASTNNIVSLHVAREAVQGGLLLLDGDLLLEPRALGPLFAALSDAVLLCQRVLLGEEEMKVCVDSSERIVAIGKHLAPSEAFAESIGVARFSPCATERLFAVVEGLVGAGETGVWYENAFQRLIDENVRFSVADATGLGCMEIDTPEDLEAARKQVRVSGSVRKW